MKRSVWIVEEQVDFGALFLGAFSSEKKAREGFIAELKSRNYDADQIKDELYNLDNEMSYFNIYEYEVDSEVKDKSEVLS